MDMTDPNKAGAFRNQGRIRGGHMDKYDFLLKQKIEQSLYSGSINRDEIEESASKYVKKTIARIITIFIVFPLVALAGAIIIWFLMRLLTGHSAFTLLN